MGELRKLPLTGMKRSPKEWAEAAKLSSLEVIIRCETNVTDVDVPKLPRLRWLNLCSTEINDQAMETSEEFGSVLHRGRLGQQHRC